MQTTEKIKNRLDRVLKELERLNELYFDRPSIGSETFVFSNGKKSEIEGHTFDKELGLLVREKMILKWVLGINN